MNTEEINKQLKYLKCFKGTYAKDLLPIKKFSFPSAFVINTDESDKPGQHWVALFMHKDEAEYFDSFGFKPLCCEIQELLRKNNIHLIKYNKYQIQSELSSVCGLYCILFIKFRCKQIDFIDFLGIFNSNQLLNDIIVSVLN